MATEFGKSTMLFSIIVCSSLLAGCAKKPPPPPPPPEPVYGYDWPPFQVKQKELAAFAGGAATNQQGLYHVLTRQAEDLPLYRSRRPLEGPNPCRILKQKIQALERCEALGQKACTFPLGLE